MRLTNIATEESVLAFAMRAAQNFRENPKHWTYSDDGRLSPGELLALRWGLGGDCVVVVRLGEDEPVNFQNMI